MNKPVQHSIVVRLSPRPHRLLDYTPFYRHPSNPSDAWQIMHPSHLVSFTEQKTTHWHLGLFVTLHKHNQITSQRGFTVISWCFCCVKTDNAHGKKKSHCYLKQHFMLSLITTHILRGQHQLQSYIFVNTKELKIPVVLGSTMYWHIGRLIMQGGRGGRGSYWRPD